MHIPRKAVTHALPPGSRSPSSWEYGLCHLSAIGCRSPSLGTCRRSEQYLKKVVVQLLTTYFPLLVTCSRFVNEKLPSIMNASILMSSLEFRRPSDFHGSSEPFGNTALVPCIYVVKKSATSSSADKSPSFLVNWIIELEIVFNVELEETTRTGEAGARPSIISLKWVKSWVQKRSLVVAIIGVGVAADLLLCSKYASTPFLCAIGDLLAKNSSNPSATGWSIFMRTNAQ